MTLYASKAGPNTTSPLYTINPATGVATSVGAMSVALTGMAYDPTTSTMYGVTSPNSVNPRRLVIVDLGTAAVTIVGELLDGSDSHNCADIAFDASGQLYGWSEFNDSLVLIDKTDGTVTPFANTMGTFGDGMDFDWEDKLYGIFNGDDDTLWQVDTSDGTVTAIAGLGGTGFAVSAGAMQDDKFYILVNQNPAVFLATVDYYGVITTIGQTLDRMDALATDDPGGRSDWHGVSPYPFTESWEGGSINTAKWTVYRQYGTSPLDPNDAESWFSITTDEARIDTHSAKLEYIAPTATNYDRQQLVHWNELGLIANDIEAWLAFQFMIPDWGVVWNSYSGEVTLPDFRTSGLTTFAGFSAIGNFLYNNDATHGYFTDSDGQEHDISAGTWHELRIGYKRRSSDSKAEVTMYLDGELIVDHSLSGGFANQIRGFQWTSEFFYNPTYDPDQTPESLVYIDPIIWNVGSDPGPITPFNFLKPDRIDPTTVLYQPSIDPGNKNVPVGFIAPTGGTFNPYLSGLILIDVPFIDANETVVAPAILEVLRARISQSAVQAMVQYDSKGRVSQVPVQAMIQLSSAGRVSQVPAQVLMQTVFEDINVFLIA